MINVALIAVLLVAHIACTVTNIFVINLSSEIPFFGGSTGFLPASDDPSGAYDRFSSFLSGADRPEIREPEATGGIGILQWAVFTPMCTISTVARIFLSTATFNYEFLTLFPSEGFGLWFKLGIHVLGMFLTVAALNQVLQFVVRTGVFSNVHTLAIVLGVSLIGAIATIADGAGPLACGG